MRENCPYGSEGGVGASRSRPLSAMRYERWKQYTSTSAVPRMREVDIAIPLRLILRERGLMFACLLQLTRPCTHKLGCALPGDKQRTKDAFHGALSSSWRMRDQAAALERRSHSSKAMRPRRASPNGISERSSTRPPKYRASGSLTTTRGSPTAFR